MYVETTEFYLLLIQFITYLFIAVNVSRFILNLIRIIIKGESK